jgi:hypothetical protein
VFLNALCESAFPFSHRVGRWTPRRGRRFVRVPRRPPSIGLPIRCVRFALICCRALLLWSASADASSAVYAASKDSPSRSTASPTRSLCPAQVSRVQPRSVPNTPISYSALPIHSESLPSSSSTTSRIVERHASDATSFLMAHWPPQAFQSCTSRRSAHTRSQRFAHACSLFSPRTPLLRATQIPSQTTQPIPKIFASGLAGRC